MTKKKKSWFMTMLSGTNGDVSSKRFFGGIGLTIMHMIAVYAVIAIPDSHWIGEFLITLSITDAGLLGVGVLEKPKKKETQVNNIIEESFDDNEG